MPPTELPPQALQALNEGRFIDAIKVIRDSSGMDLKTAKEALDSYLAAHPDLTTRWKEQQMEMVQKFKRFLSVLGSLVMAAGFFWWWKNR